MWQILTTSIDKRENSVNLICVAKIMLDTETFASGNDMLLKNGGGGEENESFLVRIRVTSGKVLECIEGTF